MATPKKGVLDGRIAKVKVGRGKGVLPQSRARENAGPPIKLSNNQVTYEQARAKYGDAVGSRERFTRLAQSDFGEKASQLAEYINAQGEQRAQQQAAKKTGEAVMADYTAVAEGRAADVKSWKDLADFTVRLKESGDPEAEDTANALMWTHAKELKQHIDVVDKGWWDKNLAEKPEEDKPWWGPVARGAAAVGEYMDQWGQSGLSAVAGVEAATDRSDGVSVKQGLRHAGRALGHALDPTRVLPDRWGGDLTNRFDPTFDPTIIDDHEQGRRLSINRNADQDRSLNLREAVGLDPNKTKGFKGSGYVVGSFDMLGSILADPTTYVGMGAPALAKIGMRSAEDVAERLAIKGLDRTAVRAMNQKIARAGFKAGLDAEEKVLYRRLVEEGVAAAKEAGGSGTTRILRRDLVEEQMKAIQRGGQSGLRFAGTTVAPTGKLGEAARAAELLTDTRFGKQEIDGVLRTVVEESKPGIVARLMKKDNAVGGILRSVKPWARLKATQGAEVAEAVNALASATKANADNLADTVELRLGTKLDALARKSVTTRSIQEFGSEKAWTSGLNEAMSDGDAFRALRPQVGEETGKLMDALWSVREEIVDDTLKIKGYDDEAIAAWRAGEMDIPGMRDVETYVARVVTGAARNSETLRVLRTLSGEESGTLGDAVRGAGEVGNLDDGFTKRRTLAPNEPNVQRVNAQVHEIMKTHGIDIEKLFEDNQPALWSMHARDVFQAKADLDLLDGITTLGTTDGGAPLGLRVIPEAAEEGAEEGGRTGLAYAHEMLREAGGDPAHYRVVPLENGTHYFVLEDIAQELENVRRIWGSPREMDHFRRFADKANNFWASSATIQGINPGFHARNEIGNLTFIYYGGVRNPIRLKQAASVQALWAKTEKHMRDTGDSLEAALTAVGGKDKTARQLKSALSQGVMAQGRSADLIRRAEREAPKTKMGAADYLLPTRQGSIWNVTGIRMGEGIEANARLALYIDQLEKGATPATAAAHTKKYLFDYDDLTRFEKEKIRLVSRFYTFTRKNLGLNLYMLAQYPARVREATDAAQGLAALVPLPGFDQDSGGNQFGLPEYLANPTLRSAAGRNIAIDVETPLGAAVETASILPRLAAVAFQAKDPLDPKTPGARLADSFDALFSGFPAAAINYARETTTRKDSFTGRPLGDQARDGGMFRLLEVMFPSLSRMESQLSSFGIARDGKNAKPREVAAAQFLLGLNAIVVDKDTDATNRYLLDQKLQELIAETEKGGIDVPTIDQLRGKGRLAAKDRVAEALLYSWTPVKDPDTGRTTGYQWDADERRKQILSIVPKDVRDLFGGELDLTDPTDPEGKRQLDGGSPGSRPDKDNPMWDAFDLQQAIRAIEAWRGKPLTQEEKVEVLLASPWAPNNTELEGLGINPIRDYENDPTANRFAPDDVKEKSFDEKQSLATAQLDALASSVGLDRATVARMRPRMSTMERVLDEARRYGVEGQELIDYLILAEDEGGGGVLSRADKAAINQLYGGSAMKGPVPITSTRAPKVTADDLRKMQTKGWQAEQELLLFAKVYGLPAPSREQLERYVLNSLMTKTEQKGLGIPTLKGAKNRKDVRSDAEKGNDASAKRAAGLRGLDVGPAGAGTGEWYENRFTLDSESD